MADADKEKYEKAQEEKKKKEEEKKAADDKKKEEAEGKMKEACDQAGDDIKALEAAIAPFKKDKAQPDTSEVEAKLDDLKTAKADDELKDSARTAADENWLLELNNAIDGLVNTWTSDYNANKLSKQKAAFEKFFDGKNTSSEEDYELARDDMVKVLTVGGDSFQDFAAGLGFKVAESDVLEEITKALEPEEKAES